MPVVMGINHSMHESSVAFLDETGLLFAQSEERFTRRKFDASFPVEAITAGLRALDLTPSDVAAKSIRIDNPDFVIAGDHITHTLQLVHHPAIISVQEGDPVSSSTPPPHITRDSGTAVLDRNADNLLKSTRDISRSVDGTIVYYDDLASRNRL